MISGKRKEALVAELNIRSHQFVAGLAEKLGGHDEGPDPHELLEAALTACTILTAQLYANRKGFALESTDVEVKIVSEGPQTLIHRQVSLRGNLSAEEKDRINEIVLKCPIHRLLESQVKIETSFA